MPCNICGLHDGNQDQCGNCEKWFCYEHRSDCEECGTAYDNCVTEANCGHHLHCGDWDCKHIVTWDCEHCGYNGNCVPCGSSYGGCERDSDGMGGAHGPSY